MISPRPIPTSKVTIATLTKNRALIRFQNVGNKAVYIKKVPLTQYTTTIADIDFQVELAKDDVFETNAINAFVAISENPGGELSIYETRYI